MSPALAGRPTFVPETLVLAQEQVAALIRTADWIESVESAFRALADGLATAPPPMALEGEGGVFHAKGAVLGGGHPRAALKLNGNFPGNPERNGLPTIQGAILLCDARTGTLLAIMDSAEVTLRRTAAATALAARHLARPESRTVMICGCGALGRAHLDALIGILPLERLFAWDRRRDRARALAAEARSAGLAAEAADSLAAARRCDLIVTCTTSAEPFLDADLVSPGSFVAAVGADSPHKSEIDPRLFARSLVVVDSLDQCLAMGDLRHAVAAGTIAPNGVHAGLAELVSGRKKGRTSAEEIIMFDSTGIAVQDVACASMIYDRAVETGIGLPIRLAAAA